MKPGMMTSFLAGLFILSAVLAVSLAGWYLLSFHQLQNAHAAFLGVNHNKAVVRSLIAESLEYRKRNPAIDPVLQAARLISPVLATNAPGKKPLP